MDRVKKFLKKHWWLVICVMAIIGIVYLFRWSDKMDEMHPRYNKENLSEVKWGELMFTDITNNGESQPLCTELTAEGQGQFVSGTEYVIRFDYPDALKAELENGRRNYQVDVQYSFQVKDGGCGYLRVTIYSEETHRMYRGESSFEAVGDLCLKHDISATPELGMMVTSEPIKFAGSEHLEFTLFTSALPDDGPKTSVSSWQFSSNWRIAGMEGEF